MITFDNIERNYEIASKSFSLDIPEFFNFAYDILDVRAQQADKVALLAIDTVTGYKNVCNKFRTIKSFIAIWKGSFITWLETR